MKLTTIALAIAAGSLLAVGATAQPLGAGHATMQAQPATCASPSPTACTNAAPKVGPVFGKKHKKNTCGKVWVPGHYEYHRERIYVPARTDRVWCPPEYRYEYQCGQLVKVLVKAGHWEVVVVEPAHYTYQRCKRWVPGHWK